MARLVMKFGGTSLADAAQAKKALAIIAAADCPCVVVSAPGKRFPGDEKVTELLFRLHHAARTDSAAAAQLVEQIAGRFRELASGIAPEAPVEEVVARLAQKAANGASLEEILSFGERLCAIIIATALGYRFVDAAQFVTITPKGDANVRESMRRFLNLGLPKGSKIVVPGYYGTLEDWATFATFTRGGSDITGAVLAVLMHAERYENWTDVSGIYTAPPAIVPNARPIPVMRYGLVRELSYMGATVLHSQALVPALQKLGTEVLIKNTNRPEDPGTRIVSDAHAPQALKGSIVGIAGRGGFSSVRLAAWELNRIPGALQIAGGACSGYGISVEHMPTGIDSVSLIVSSSQLMPQQDALTASLAAAFAGSDVTIRTEHGFAMLCVVGDGMAHTPGVLEKITGTLARTGINIRMCSQNDAEVNVVIGVDDAALWPAIRALHAAFFE